MLKTQKQIQVSKNIQTVRTNSRFKGNTIIIWLFQIYLSELVYATLFSKMCHVIFETMVSWGNVYISYIISHYPIFVAYWVFTCYLNDDYHKLKTKLYKGMNKENHNLNWSLFQRRKVLREDTFQWLVIHSAQLIFIRFAKVFFEQSFCVIIVSKTNFCKDKVVTSKQIIHFYFFRKVKMKMLNVHAHFPSPLQTKSFTFICIEFVLEYWPCKACYKKVAT